MKYWITKPVAGNPPLIEITEEQYTVAFKAWRCLLEITYWEEKFDYLIGNYVEFEEELMRSSLSTLVYHELESSWMSEQRGIVNRRLANLLTTAKMYEDHSRGHLIRAFGRESAVLKFVDGQRENLKETEFEFQVIDELRNLAQHNDFPINAISYPMGWVDEWNAIEHKCIPYIRPTTLVKDTRFSKKVGQFDLSKEYLDIRPFIRKYMELICELHEKTREKIDASVTEWDQEVRDVFTSYEKQWNADKLTSVALMLEEDKSKGKYEELHIALLERRERFVTKNRSFGNFSKRFFSSK